jgi:hypothetical protein
MNTRFFERSFTLLILMFTLPLLFLPKINLLSMGGRETAGIRIDDAVLMIFAILFGWTHFQLNRRLCDVEKWVFAIVGFSLISFCINRFLFGVEWIHVTGNLLYAVRILEYFSFFYIGLLAIEFVDPSVFIKSFIFWDCAIMVFQKAGLLGEFGMYGYNPSATYRPPGICSFPSEAGAMLNMLFCYLIFQPKTESTKIPFWPPAARQVFDTSYLYAMFLIFGPLTVITGSRIAIFAVAVIFLFCVFRGISWRTPWTIAVSSAIILIGGTLLALVIVENKDMIHRSKGLFSMKNIELAEMVWDSVDVTREPYVGETLTNQGADMSWWMRIRKWCYVLKIYVTHPETYLQGVGPGFAFAGLDGGYLRILVENGIVGVLLFWNFFKCIAKKSPQLMAMVVAFAINMVFFDVYIAYKPMSLLFLVAGMTWGTEARKSVLQAVPA